MANRHEISWWSYVIAEKRYDLRSVNSKVERKMKKTEQKKKDWKINYFYFVGMAVFYEKVENNTRGSNG